MFSLFLYTGLGALFAAGWQTLLARFSGPEFYGLFYSFIVITNILSSIICFGFSQMLMKESSKDRSYWKKNIFSVILSLTISGVVVTLIVVNVIGSLVEDYDSFYIYLVALSLAFYQVTNSKFQINFEYKKLSKWQLTPHLLRFGLILIVFFGFVKLDDLYLFWSLISFFIICIALYHFDLFKSETVFDFGLAGCKRVYLNGFSFGISSFIHLLLINYTPIVVSYELNSTEVGYYFVIQNFLFSSYLIPTVLYQKYYQPKIYKWFEDYGFSYDFHKKLKKIQNESAFLCLGMFLFMVLISKLYIVFLGDTYSELYTYFIIVCFIMPMRFCSGYYGALLNINNFIKDKVKIQVVVLSISAVPVFSMIFYYGFDGAILSLFLMEAMLCLLMRRKLRVLVKNEN